MQWVLKLYLLGLALSLLSVLFGLLGFLGDLLPPQGLDPCLPSRWMEAERSSLVDGRPAEASWEK